MATPAGGVDILDALMIIDRQTSAAPHLTLSMVPQLIHINGCDAAITSKSSLADGDHDATQRRTGRLAVLGVPLAPQRPARARTRQVSLTTIGA